MKTRRRLRRFLTFLSMALPFVLPALVLAVWLAGRCDGQDAEPLYIVASMDPDGGHTTTFSTIITDGAEAVWTCSEGTFLETGTSEAPGRTVTWQPESGSEDSVTVIITTPSVSDTVRFLPVVPETVPNVTVSAAYHLALLERARSVQLPPGTYRTECTGEGLRNYDGLVILVVQTAGMPRTAHGMLPGDTLEIELPLGGTVTATGIDQVDAALDNAGIVHVTFFPTGAPAGWEEPPPPDLPGEDVASQPPSESPADGLPARSPVLLPTLPPRGPRLMGLLPVGTSSGETGDSPPAASAGPAVAGLLMMDGSLPEEWTEPADVRIAGRTPGSATENALPGIYFVAGDPAAWRTASALSRAGLGEPRPVLTLLTVRADAADAFSRWLGDLDPAAASRTAVIVETPESVANGAGWIRAYALYAAGDASASTLRSGFTGDSLPGLPASRRDGVYSVVLVP